MAGGAGFGGNVVVRASAFWDVDGFRATLPASQDRALAIDLLDAGKRVVPMSEATVAVDNSPRESVGRSVGAGVRRLPFLATYFHRVPAHRRRQLVLQGFWATLTPTEPFWSAGLLLATFPAAASKALGRARRYRASA